MTDAEWHAHYEVILILKLNILHLHTGCASKFGLKGEVIYFWKTKFHWKTYFPQNMPLHLKPISIEFVENYFPT